MRSLLFIALGLMSLNSLASRNLDAIGNVSLEIWNYDYSMAQTMYYRVENDTLIVKSIGGLVGEKDSILIRRQLSLSEQKELYSFFSTTNLFVLKSKYENPLVEDGDRKTVVLKQSNKKKKIEIANFYQKDLAQLFIVINKLLPVDKKISYIK